MEKEAFGLLSRPNYAYGLLRAADIALYFDKRAELLIGDIEDTVAGFTSSIDPSAPLGFMSEVGQQVEASESAEVWEEFEVHVHVEAAAGAGLLDSTTVGGRIGLEFLDPGNGTEGLEEFSSDGELVHRTHNRLELLGVHDLHLMMLVHCIEARAHAEGLLVARPGHGDLAHQLLFAESVNDDESEWQGSLAAGTALLLLFEPVITYPSDQRQVSKRYPAHRCATESRTGWCCEIVSSRRASEID